MLPLNLLKKTLVLAGLCVGLFACEPPSKPDNQTVQADINSSTPTAIASTSQANQVKKIDWQKIASNETAIDPKTFTYPFELDSEVVKMYAKEYNLDNETARYQMTVGMAVNEVLAKLLDELGTSYVSHEMNNQTKIPSLVVHTTAEVATLEKEYVFADKFAKGLIINVKIINDGIKQPIKNPHSEL